MKTFREIFRESIQATLLNSYGYRGPYRGADGHNSFILDEHIEILIDLPGNEWHYVVDGVVKIVGHLNDQSLVDFLRGKITPQMETEETEDNRLAKAKIYEPDGGTYSSTPSTPGDS